MASITSLTSSGSTSSLFANSNIISGLASGMDTESMIENAVSGYQKKITSLQQDVTVYEWQQEAYRSIIDKLVNFNKNYADYTSGTNLLSQSFFNSATSVSASGTYAALVSASGSTDSAVQLLGVKQLAAAAAYTVTGIAGSQNSTVPTISGSAIDFSGTEKVSAVSGSLRLSYGGGELVTLSFGKNEVYEDGEALAAAINEKLAEKDIGDVTATFANGEITFSGSDGEEVTVKAASGDMKQTLGIEADAAAITVGAALYEEKSVSQLLEEQEISFTVDGVTKKITVGSVDSIEELRQTLQTELDEAFGSGKVTVAQNNEGGLNFETQKGSAMQITNGSILGLDSDNETSFVNTSQTLRDILGQDMGGLEATADGKYALTINGDTTLEFSADDTLANVMNAINKADAGVKVTYSKTTNQFMFTATETGAAGQAQIGGALGQALFAGGSTTAGQDAILSMTVNGVEMTNITRSSNSFEVDGLTINLKGAFNYEETGVLKADAQAVSFAVETDSDKIVDAIKTMIKDYNEMATEIKNAYSTMPLENSSGDPYEPLTDDDMADMSESAIKSYEEKAKTGLLFGDRDLSALYSALRSAVSDATLSKIGITASYSEGMTTLVLDEDKLRSALESDPDSVRDAIAGTAEKDGMMQKLDTTLEKYAKTSGATKGILIEKAGSAHSTTSLLSNQLLDKINSVQEEIEKWQEKLSDRVDYYTNQFTQLEVLINEMNSQSSALAGLMGG